MVTLSQEPDGLVGIVTWWRVVESADDASTHTLKIVHGGDSVGCVLYTVVGRLRKPEASGLPVFSTSCSAVQYSSLNVGYLSHGPEASNMACEVDGLPVRE